MRSRILDTVFPPQCGGCGVLGSGFCDACAGISSPIEARRDALAVRALGEYSGRLRAAVLALKDGRRDVAQALGYRLAGIVRPGSLLVPVPTTRARRRTRGFDGCEELARVLCEHCRTNVVAALVHLSGDAQRGRSREERLRARGRFGCIRDVTGKRLVLLDDVCTTGSTLLDCASALRSCGATVDEAVVVAVAPNEPGP